MLPLGVIFQKYNIASHSYADDIQIYFELTDDLCLCTVCVRSNNGSQETLLNDKKTEIVVFDSNIPRGQLPDALGSLASSISDTVSNLGVLLDSS